MMSIRSIHQVRMRPSWYLIATWCLAAIGFAWNTRAVQSQPLPQSLISDVGIDQRIGSQLRLQTAFRDERSRPVALQDYFQERPVVLMMVYHRCPMLCGEQLKQLSRSLNALDLRAGRDYELVVISISPTETPQLAAKKKRALAMRATDPQASNGWHFLTGEKSQIDDIASDMGFRYRYDPETGQYAHAAGLVVVTPNGTLSRYFLGLDFPTRGLRQALIQASQGRLGTPMERFLLLCFHYNPLQSRYGQAIAWSLRMAGVMTMASIAGYVGRHWWRDRKVAGSP